MASPTCSEPENGEACPAEPVAGFHRCLAHLPPDQLDEFLATLRPGSSLEIRKTVLPAGLLDRIRAAMTDDDGEVCFGAVDFTETVFRPDEVSLKGAPFSAVKFTEDANFTSARFPQGASFGKSTFRRRAVFDHAEFSQRAEFAEVDFQGEASFDGAAFKEVAFFNRSSFSGARFSRATFARNTSFSEASFRGRLQCAGAYFAVTADFKAATFDITDVSLGPVAAIRFELDEAVFKRPVTIELAADWLSCIATRFEGATTLRIRRAGINLERAEFNARSTITSIEDFREPWPGEPFESIEDMFLRSHLLSLQGVDVTNLTIADLDVQPCLFGGAHHLDKLRIEGDCVFGNPPSGTFFRWGWPPIRRWSRRQVIAEEGVWRGKTWPGWAGGGSAEPLGARRLADLYRQLRKAQEDSKNEPGAADFYYGEMEMRRNDWLAPLAERIIISLYWATSGYGLRAGRALLWLLGLLLLAGLLFQHFGLATGTTSYLDGLIDCAGSAMSLDVVKSENLTRAGQVLRIVLRIGAPLFLGLALLAVRNRVKR